MSWVNKWALQWFVPISGRSFQTEISCSSFQQFDLHPHGLSNSFLLLYEVKKEDKTLPIFTPGSTRTSKVNKNRQKFCFLTEREILKCTTHKKPVLFFNLPFKNCTLNSHKSATELKVGLSLHILSTNLSNKTLCCGHIPRLRRILSMSFLMSQP